MLSSESEGKTRSTETKPRFVERLTVFLQKYRIVLLVILIALALFVVVYFGCRSGTNEPWNDTL